MGRGQGTSVRQMAKALDVSVATVSRALNNHPEVAADTRERVLALAAKSNYQRTRVKDTRTKTIGLLYPSSPVVSTLGTFESALLAGIMRGLREQRYSLAIVDAEHERHPGETLAAFVRRKGIAGVLVRTPGAGPGLAEEVASLDIPAVLLADRTDDDRLHYVYSDSGPDSTRAVQHLAQLGHRRVGLIIHEVIDHDHQDRLRGYRAGLEAAGLAFDESLVITNDSNYVDSGARALDSLLARDPSVTAVYVTNPLATVGVLHRCLARGIRVPEQFSVVGFDDCDSRFQTYPNYTAVLQDAGQMGHDAAAWISRRLEGLGPETFRVRRATTLSVLNTTAPAPR